jgi:exodeoxyribonuclease VIII
LEAMNNAQYHSNRTHLNSSALKLLLKSPEQFYAEWFQGIKERVYSAVFAEGSLTHSLILEPEKVQQEYAFYEGLRKQGERWEEFKKANDDKSVLSLAQKLRCERYVDAYRARVEAVHILQNGLAEHTMAAEVLDVPVKARADYINIDAGYIVDVKTTSMPMGIDYFKTTVGEYDYDLSAALYCQIAYECYGKLFDFYFIVISKADLVCDIYKCSSDTLSNGTAKMTQALVLYKRCLASGLWVANQAKASYDSKEYEILEV